MAPGWDATTCPDYTNAGQEDGDFDAVGNYCDNFPGDPSNDADGDGFPATNDNCPLNANSTQDKLDLDPFGDACDLCDDFFDDIVRDLDHDPDRGRVRPGRRR